MSDNYFEQLSRVDISTKIKKKGQFSYLSWAHAVEELGRIDPTANWEVKRFDGMPYLKSELGYFVEVEVTVKGISKSQIHPVLDNRNAPIAKPNAFQINTSIQRCLSKAIALHGLGLSVFYGEDILPDLVVEKQKIAQEQEAGLLAKSESLIRKSKTMTELVENWKILPKKHHLKLNALKDEIKASLTEVEA
jgi:hypothetical protein